MKQIETIEDGYEWRVRKIFERLRKTHKEQDDGDFLDWIETHDGSMVVAEEFLNDVQNYMGVPLVDGETS